MTRWSTATTVFPSEGTNCRPGELISITRPSINSGTTAPTVLYRVTSVYAGFYEAILVDAQQLFNEASWFPSRVELNRKAAIEGAIAQHEKHKRVPKNALVARRSFQQMARLPCYRGTRSR